MGRMVRQLSGNNPLNQKLMIENEFEMRYEEKLKTKANEIDILNNKINYLQRENDDLKAEIDNLKLNNQKQFNLEKERSEKLLSPLYLPPSKVQILKLKNWEEDKVK